MCFYRFLNAIRTHFYITTSSLHIVELIRRMCLRDILRSLGFRAVPFLTDIDCHMQGRSIVF